MSYTPRNTTAESLVAFFAEHSADDWATNSDGYQHLIEECGDELVPGLVDLLEHPSPDVRAACVALLATRRPHTVEIAERVRSLVWDVDPLVRTLTWTHLKEFGRMAHDVVQDALRVIEEERLAEDQYPRVAAIGFLLTLDQDYYSPIILPALIELLDRSTDATPLVLATLMEVEGVEVRYEEDLGDEGR